MRKGKGIRITSEVAAFVTAVKKAGKAVRDFDRCYREFDFMSRMNPKRRWNKKFEKIICVALHEAYLNWKRRNKNGKRKI